jgi:hypothetical protein
MAFRTSLLIESRFTGFFFIQSILLTEGEAELEGAQRRPIPSKKA